MEWFTIVLDMHVPQRGLSGRQRPLSLHSKALQAGRLHHVPKRLILLHDMSFCTFNLLPGSLCVAARRCARRS